MVLNKVIIRYIRMFNVFFSEISGCWFKPKTNTNFLSLIPSITISNILSGMEKLVAKNVRSVDVPCFILGHKRWGNGGHVHNPTLLPKCKSRESTLYFHSQLFSPWYRREGGGR